MKNLVFTVLMATSWAVSALDVDPAKSVFGVPWNSSEQEAEKKLGKPSGYFQATKYKKFVFYGKSVALVFEREKLKGLIYSNVIFSALYDEAVSINERFSTETIRLNGVELNDKGFAELAAKLPYKLGKPTYQVKVATDEAQIQLNFSGREEPGSASTFSFHGLEIHYEL
jgi:hypothetical protein